VTFSKKQRGVSHKHDKQKQCHMSHIKYPDLATTWNRLGSNGRVPGSST